MPRYGSSGSSPTPMLPHSAMTPPPIIPAKRKQTELNLGGKVVRIVVGKDREEFSIHAKRLEKTAFFAYHGAPGERLDMSMLKPAGDTICEEALEKTIKLEDGEAAPVQNPTGLSPEDQALLDDPPDYLIAPGDYRAAKAWGYFASWIYNEEIPMLKAQTDVTIALKAYRYARYYDAWELQNTILDRFRQHYLVHKVGMKELTDLTNKFGDDANATPLTRYIVEQIAYDITTRGFYEFANENGWIDYFLKEGDRKIRHAMFIILSRHANNNGIPKDPAENHREWKVLVAGENAGSWTPKAYSDK